MGYRIAEQSSVLQPSSSYTGLFSQDGCTPVRWGRMDEQSSVGHGRMYDRVVCQPSYPILLQPSSSIRVRYGRMAEQSSPILYHNLLRPTLDCSAILPYRTLIDEEGCSRMG